MIILPYNAWQKWILFLQNNKVAQEKASVLKNETMEYSCFWSWLSVT